MAGRYEIPDHGWALIEGIDGALGRSRGGLTIKIRLPGLMGLPRKRCRHLLADQATIATGYAGTATGMACARLSGIGKCIALPDQACHACSSSAR